MDLEHFREVWNNADSVKDVAEKLGRSYNDVTKTASLLRKSGLELKKMYNPETLARAGRKGGRAKNVR